MDHIPSRTLNENRVFMGLGFEDLVGLGVLMGGLQVCLKPLHLEVYALWGAMIAGVVLIPVRLRYRKKVIRDALGYLLLPKVLVGPSSRSRATPLEPPTRLLGR